MWLKRLDEGHHLNGELNDVGSICRAPLQLRLAHAAPDIVYSRWELPTAEAFIDALRQDGSGRTPEQPDPQSLMRFGVRDPRPNDAVRAYVSSPLHGLIQPGTLAADLGMSKRHLDNFRQTVGATGFHGTEYRSRSRGRIQAPRWPDVLHYLLRLLGRTEVPTSSHDQPWMLTKRSGLHR